MTQALAVNDIIKAQLWCHGGAQASVNTLHYKVTAVGGTIATLEDFASTWSSAMATVTKTLLAVPITFDGVLAQIISPLPLMVAVKDSSGTGPGVGGTNLGPPQTAGIISWLTPLAGPGGRGRTYLPFPCTEDMEADGIPSATYVTNLTAWANAALDFITVSAGGRSATVQLGFRQKKTAAWVAITSFFANQKWATQKRRGAYGRPNFSPF